MSNSVSSQGSQSINYQFKLLYALGMIFVVAGHSATAHLPLFEQWFTFSSFHLGLFVFCSGYFYKETSEDNVLQYIQKKLKTLILPLFLWNLFYALVTTIFCYFGMTIGGEVTLSKLFLDPIQHGHQFIYNLGGWFVIPLFMIEVFNVLLCKLLSLRGTKKFAFLFVLYIIIGILGNKMSIAGYHYFWWLVPARMLYLLPFYGFGMLYKNLLEEKDVLPNRWYFSIIFTCQLAIFYTIKTTQSWIVMPAWCDFYNGPVLPVISGFLAIAFWLRVARILAPVIGNSKSVLAIANNTFSIMINQFLGFILIKSFFALTNVSFGWFKDFDFQKYKTDIWYYYFPNNIEHICIVYIAAGIIIPIYMQKAVDWAKIKISSFRKQ